MAWSAIAAAETDADSPLNQALMDKIRGNLDQLYADTGSGAGIAQGNLKTTTEEETFATTTGDLTQWVIGNVKTIGASYVTAVSYLYYDKGAADGARWNAAAATVYQETFASVGSYGFFPQIKYDANTAYIQIRYIQASRDEPIVFLRVRKADNFIEAAQFNPEARGDRHPFINYWEGEGYANDPHGEYDFVCIQLKDSPLLCEHLYKNYGKAGHSWLWQIYLALYTGIIRLSGPGVARLPAYTDKTKDYEAFDLVDPTIAPCLHHPDTKLMSFDFDQELLKKLEAQK